MAGGGAGSGRGFGAYSAAAGGASAGAPALVGRSRASRAQLVFIKTPAGLEPRPVRLGISDFDYSEVLSGLKEGDQVALLSVAELQAKRKDDQSRIRQRMGGGVPGVPGGAGGGGGGGGGRGGGGGGGRGGP
jgi:HlyD family secretion protein